ncbi:MAG TPA: hypothetical protein VFX85_07735 [Solirubrobacterales bacterium]|nr:hypothetical protein [Solirubrobacterales bacterium]
MVTSLGAAVFSGVPTPMVDPAGAAKLPPPRAWTTEAESLEATDAGLHGVIDPRGVPTTYHFQLGPTKSYGRIVTGTRGTYEGNRPREVGAVAFNLRPRILYHYRIVAISDGGKAFGADKTFKTFFRTATPDSVISCFHKKARRYTALPHPRRCILRGHRGKKYSQVSVDGMRWGHWGFNPTRAAYGSDTRDGAPIRVIAFRPVACGDGRTFYSQVTVYYPSDGRGFVLRLPTCDSATVLG